MSKWYSFEELKRARTPMPLDSETGLPDNHVITVVERVISVDNSELIQNNVRTDTITLNLDAEYDDLNIIVIFTKSNNINVQVAYSGQPVHIPASVMELTGSVAVSVVGLDAEGETRAVTKAAPDTFQVVASGAYTGKISQDDVDLLGQILQVVSDAETATTAAETATTAATNATSQANSAATSANQAASSANSAASSANSAAARATSAAVNAENAYNTLQPYMATIDSCANILHREVGPDSVVTADDSFPAKPVEMTVYGNTVQNLWVNPSGTDNGVTVTSNADGSIRVEGTTTGNVSLNSGKKYTLKPSTLYTISVDKKLSDSLTDASQGSFFIEQRSQAGSLISGSTRYVGYGNTLWVTFTTSGELSYVYMGVFAVSGKTFSGTYRVMLNEGSEAEPWCPPGLNSVGDDGSVKIVTAGKNLIRISSSPLSDVGVSVVKHDDGSVTFDGIAADTFWFYDTALDFYLPSGTYTLSGFDELPEPMHQYVRVESLYEPQGSNVGRFVGLTISTGTVKDGGPHYFRLVISSPAGTEFDNVTIYPQLELGSTATDYEPPNITTTPIDLQGHTLNSLPNGTRDELHIDGGGNVVLEKRVGAATFDGSEDEAWEYAGDRIGFNNGAPGSDTIEAVGANGRCDTLPVREVSSSPAISSYNGGWVDIRNDAAITDLETGKAWLAANHTTLLYPLALPKTISLGTITPPTMAAPNVTAYVADDTPAEMGLDYVRDINIVVDRLEKKVADLVVTEATIV